MNILALDGALGSFSAAVARDDRAIASVSEAGNVALERGLAIAREVMTAAGLEPAGIERLAVGVGPGSFTGLRVAIAYAKSLAAAWRRPLVPVSSFDLLEYGNDFERVLTVVVGRPGVISARYRSAAGQRRASGRIADVMRELFAGHTEDDATPLTVIGAPKDVLHALAERRFTVIPALPAIMPAAAAAALAAARRVPPPSVHEITADYGELPAARVPKR